MQTVVIGKNQAGQRFDKFLHKYLPQAGNSFLYKMLRKKNITLNGKKAEGKEILSEGDVVESFFSEETFAKFSGQVADESFDKNLGSQDLTKQEGSHNFQNLQDSRKRQYPQNCQSSRNGQYLQFVDAYKKLRGIGILYEDEHIVIVNKPAGILTQKAKPEDLSLNEWLIGFLLAGGGISEEELSTFHPSVCNRLDRNTSGIVLCGKSLAGSQMLSSIIKDHSLRKFYRTICVGDIKKDVVLEGVLVKDHRTNKVTIQNKEGLGEYIRTAFHPLACENGYTYLEVELFTGKTHQIRAQLAAMGHPITGDFKYGNKNQNQYFLTRYGLKSHLLHAHHVIFPMDAFAEGLTQKKLPEAILAKGAYKEVLGHQFTAPCPKLFEKMTAELFPEFWKEDKS